MKTDAKRFTESFDARSREDWIAAATKALKTVPFERLKSSTLDGIAIEPIYTRSEAPVALGARVAGRPWGVTARIDIPGNKIANAQILEDLEGGASGLDLVLAESPNAHGWGLTVSCSGCVANLLAGVHLDLIPIRIDGGRRTAEVVGLIADFAAAQGKTVDLALIQDPVGELAATGQLATTLEEAITAAAATAATFAGTVFEADGRVWHGAGASEAQELAGLLATAATYLRALEAAGLDLASAVSRIGFTAVADQNQFHTIAKLRALTLLWARVQEACGLTPVAPRIHAETARRMMTRHDPDTNMLRTTVATFAAGVAGAASLTVLPYTSSVGLPDAFARRVARNTQSILIEESNLHRVADPAAGSGLVDTETRQLAERAWSLFQAIEAQGGMAAALRSGSFQAEVAATAKKRMEAIAKRRVPVTGVSEFPNIAETVPAVMDVAPPKARTAPSVEEVTAFAPRALGEAYEALRDRADAAAARPKVFLANLGRIASFTVRATWAKNFFEAGGIAALTNDGFASLDEMVAAFAASGTKAAILCSSDAVYAEQAVEAAAALKRAGAAPLYLAGKPVDAEVAAAYTAAGIDGFIHVGVDVVATLTAALDRLGA